MRFRHHVFVCVHTRPDRGRPSCGARGADEIVTELSVDVLRRGLGGEIAVTTSGCLGPCFEGPNVVVYPEGVWYRGVGVADVGELVDAIEAGTVVERLVRPDDDDDDEET